MNGEVRIEGKRLSACLKKKECRGEIIFGGVYGSDFGCGEVVESVEKGELCVGWSEVDMLREDCDVCRIECNWLMLWLIVEMRFGGGCEDGG